MLRSVYFKEYVNTRSLTNYLEKLNKFYDFAIQEQIPDINKLEQEQIDQFSEQEKGKPNFWVCISYNQSLQTGNIYTGFGNTVGCEYLVFRAVSICRQQKKILPAPSRPFLL